MGNFALDSMARYRNLSLTDKLPKRSFMPQLRIQGEHLPK